MAGSLEASHHDLPPPPGYADPPDPRESKKVGVGRPAMGCTMQYYRGQKAAERSRLGSTTPENTTPRISSLPGKSPEGEWDNNCWQSKGIDGVYFNPTELKAQPFPLAPPREDVLRTTSPSLSSFRSRSLHSPVSQTPSSGDSCSDNAYWSVPHSPLRESVTCTSSPLHHIWPPTGFSDSPQTPKRVTSPRTLPRLGSSSTKYAKRPESLNAKSQNIEVFNSGMIENFVISSEATARDAVPSKYSSSSQYPPGSFPSYVSGNSIYRPPYYSTLPRTASSTHDSGRFSLEGDSYGCLNESFDKSTGDISNSHLPGPSPSYHTSASSTDGVVCSSVGKGCPPDPISPRLQKCKHSQKVIQNNTARGCVSQNINHTYSSKESSRIPQSKSATIPRNVSSASRAKFGGTAWSGDGNTSEPVLGRSLSETNHTVAGVIERDDNTSCNLDRDPSPHRWSIRDLRELSWGKKVKAWFTGKGKQGKHKDDAGDQSGAVTHRGVKEPATEKLERRVKKRDNAHRRSSSADAGHKSKHRHHNEALTLTDSNSTLDSHTNYTHHAVCDTKSLDRHFTRQPRLTRSPCFAYVIPENYTLSDIPSSTASTQEARSTGAGASSDNKTKAVLHDDVIQPQISSTVNVKPVIRTVSDKSNSDNDSLVHSNNTGSTSSLPKKVTFKTHHSQPSDSRQMKQGGKCEQGCERERTLANDNGSFFENVTLPHETANSNAFRVKTENHLVKDISLGDLGNHQSNNLDKDQCNGVGKDQGDDIGKDQGNVVGKKQCNVIGKAQGNDFGKDQCNVIGIAQGNDVGNDQGNNLSRDEGHNHGEYQGDIKDTRQSLRADDHKCGSGDQVKIHNVGVHCEHDKIVSMVTSNANEEDTDKMFIRDAPLVNESDNHNSQSRQVSTVRANSTYLCSTHLDYTL